MPSSYRRASESRNSFTASSLAWRTYFLSKETSPSLSLSTFVNTSVFSSDFSKAFFVRSSFLIWTSLWASSSWSPISAVSALSLRQSTSYSQAMQWSIRPFIINTPCKNQNIIRNKVTKRRERKKDGCTPALRWRGLSPPWPRLHGCPSPHNHQNWWWTRVTQ